MYSKQYPVVIDDGTVQSATGAFAKTTQVNQDASAIGSVYLNNDAEVSGILSGAYAGSKANTTATGNVYLNDNAKGSTVYGANASTGSPTSATITIDGNVYLNNDASASTIHGSHVLSLSKTNATGN